MGGSLGENKKFVTLIVSIAWKLWEEKLARI
jgi:hypothetical protein